jgi:RNA polymerase sigma factor (sigma-70 family)
MVFVAFSRDPLRNPEPLLRSLYAYVAYRIGAGPDAEDITCEALERAVRYRRSYDPRKGEPIAWLIGIARRLIDSGATTSVATADVSGAAAPVDVEGEAVERLTLLAAVADLDERDRELIALHYGADLSPREIAELLGARTNAIEVALHRARGRLREKLEQSDAPAASQGIRGRV